MELNETDMILESPEVGVAEVEVNIVEIDGSNGGHLVDFDGTEIEYEDYRVPTDTDVNLTESGESSTKWDIYKVESTENLILETSESETNSADEVEEKDELPKSHAIKETKKKDPYHCEFCSLAFVKKKHLEEHVVKVHTGEKPYWCKICNKLFSLQGNFNTHMRTHTGQKPYQCRKCDKSFADKSNLNKHAYIHDDDRPFLCVICNTYFREMAHLKKHNRIHTGQKPYHCQLCEAKFNQNSDLKRHMVCHGMGVKTHSCTLCNKSFDSNWKCVRHMKTHYK